jgi:hypothetical protein
MPTDCKAAVLSTKLHKHDAFHKHWVWPDNEKNVNFSFYKSVENGLSTHGISSTEELCDDCVGGSSSAKKEEEDECNLESVMSIAKSHSVYKTLKSFFHTHAALANMTNTTL